MAAGTASRNWKGAGGGAALIAEHPELAKAGPEIETRVERMIRDWQGEVLDMVRSEAGQKRTTARYLAFGVNALAVMLMIIVFTSTAGLTGVEVGIAGGSAVLAQRLLEAIFGDQAVRELAAKARKALLAKVATLFEGELGRYEAVLDGVQLSPEAVRDLAGAAHHVEENR